MSEQNILNANAADPLGPNYGYAVGKLPDVVLQPRSGIPYIRTVDLRGRTVQMQWLARLLSTRHSLEQWEEQYRDGYFTFYEIERARYFTGRFAAPLTYSPTNNDQWNISGAFVEIPGLPMYQYPSNWARDAIFWEQNDDFGNARTKQTGVWTPATNANAHPAGGAGDELTNTNLNTTDMIELEYFGYGFQLWARTANNLGIFSIQTQLNGAAEVAATNVDLYTAGNVAAAAVFSSPNLKLGKHRVIITATNTKNALSAAKTILFDAIQIMR